MGAYFLYLFHKDPTYLITFHQAQRNNELQVNRTKTTNVNYSILELNNTKYQSSNTKAHIKRSLI